MKYTIQDIVNDLGKPKSYQCKFKGGDNIITMLFDYDLKSKTSFKKYIEFGSSTLKYHSGKVTHIELSIMKKIKNSSLSEILRVLHIDELSSPPRSLLTMTNNVKKSIEQ